MGGSDEVELDGLFRLSEAGPVGPPPPLLLLPGPLWEEG